MIHLLTLEDFDLYKSITSNADTDKLAMYINEAQEFDLREILGTELYEDLLDDFAASPSLTKYSDLWNGCKYTIPGQNSTPPKTFTHNGLKPVLIYYSYARYLQYCNIFSTPSGMVNKVSDQSQSISEKAKATLIDQAKSGAQAYWSRTRKYILDNITLFPLYRYITPIESGGGIKIAAIGGNTSLRDQRYLNILCRNCGRYCGGGCGNFYQ